MDIQLRYEDGIIHVKVRDDFGNVIDTSEELGLHIMAIAKAGNIEEKDENCNRQTTIAAVISAINTGIWNANNIRNSSQDQNSHQWLDIYQLNGSK